MEVARRVAKAIRGSSGGLKGVKALALEVDGQAQVSINLVDTERTPMHRAFDMVRMEAEAWGVTPTWSEIVGLVPERVLFDAAVRHVRLDKFSVDQVLERQVRTAIQGGESLSGFVGSVASPAPVPGGGSVAALAGALGAALAQMVAGLTIGKKKYAAVDAEMKEVALTAAALVNELSTLVTRDAAAYSAVAEAYKLPKEPESAAAIRGAAVAGALLAAAAVPLETARACARVAELAATVAQRGNANAASDAGVAALLAEAACKGASYNVRINVASLDDTASGSRMLDEVRALVARTSEHAARATAAVERAM
jgi:glutamate formiminotransferase/formiminotetrahydrofolate cyclodeaminase